MCEYILVICSLLLVFLPLMQLRIGNGIHPVRKKLRRSYCVKNVEGFSLTCGECEKWAG